MWGRGTTAPPWLRRTCINCLIVSVSRWNSWLEPFRFHVNCIHFRGAVFVHVGSAQMCTENGVSFYMCSAVVAQINYSTQQYTCVIAFTVAFSRGVYSGCAGCAAHTMSNWSRRDISQVVPSRENHKKLEKICMSQWLYQHNFKTVSFQLAWFSWHFHRSLITSFPFRFLM